MDGNKKETISFVRKISKGGRNTMIIVPKQLVDAGIIKVGKLYKIHLEEIEDNKD